MEKQEVKKTSFLVLMTFFDPWLLRLKVWNHQCLLAPSPVCLSRVISTKLTKEWDPAFSTTNSVLPALSSEQHRVAVMRASWRGQGSFQVFYNRMVARWTNHRGEECTFMDISHTTAISHWMGSLAAFESAPKLISDTIFEKLDKHGLKQTKYYIGLPLVKAFKHRQVGVRSGTSMSCPQGSTRVFN